MALPLRKDVPLEQTWNVNDLYPTKKAWSNDLRNTEILVTNFKTKYTNSLTTPKDFKVALEDYATIQKHLEWLEHFAFLQQSVDMTNPEANQLLRTFSNFAAQISAQLTFFKTVALEKTPTFLDEIATLSPQFKPVIREWKNAQKHQLAPEVETLLASLEPIFNQPENIYTQARAADFKFPDFQVAGKNYPLSFVTYENSYQFSPNHTVRRAAFKNFSNVLNNYKNTLAANYYAQVLREKKIATLRGYSSVIDYLLADQEVSRDLFDRQIDTIIAQLGPVMQKYVKLIQKQRHLSEMTFADLQIDLDPDFSPKIPLDQAPKYISDALQILGTNYQEMILQAFSKRWVDFPTNKGKESGGFETTPYGSHPYILMSWSNELADVYTLVHELGHAGQALLTQQQQNILVSEPSLYIVEAPSTFNELLLTHSIEQKSTDKRMQRFAYTKMLTNTYYHNFVTHLLEAAFQREVYTLIDAGQGFDGDKLCAIKKSILQRFWGDAVKIDDNAALTWMRQSHYYMGLYSYSYSASLTIATQAFLKLLANPTKGVANWLAFLKLGNQKTPLEAAKVAGVDVSTKKPLEETIAFLDSIVDKIILLTNQLEG
ncbi:oligoendopeptidase F [Ligilactobacillus sp. WILCCON 0076]|uniref:Oligopeptidase F n=1 Tax=Ligilactobacillus ubinensis TaxID=2876789 RepID=A0A9X2JMC2_9LACO|nr:oligoendopeptidase F [Ligilactobacillus ubinensis]MCP0887759.1 oligoendopeptidase F [Ligilactobacillus ubinensis]